MDERELIIHDIIAKEEKVKHLKEMLNEKEKIIEELSLELKNIEKGVSEGDKKKIAKELNDLDIECINAKQNIEKINIEIEQLKEKIEKSRKQD